MTDPTPIMDAAERLRMLAELEDLPALPCDPNPVVNGLALRKALGRQAWGVPRPNGCCGWMVDGLATGSIARVIVTADHITDSVNWIHASISRRHSMPTYGDLKLLHAAVFGDRWAYQVFAPPAQHVNIHVNALHLYGRTDGQPALPDFGRFGTI